MKKILAVILMMSFVFFCGCSEKDTRNKVGLGIVTDTSRSFDASSGAPGNMEVYAVAALAVFDGRGKIVDSKIDAISMRIAVDSDGHILYAEGTPDSVLENAIPKDLSDKALKEASDHAQYVDAADMGKGSLRLFSDFSGSMDAVLHETSSCDSNASQQEITGLVDALLYAGYTFEYNGTVSLAGLSCKEYKTIFDKNGHFVESSEESVLLNESLFFAEYCKGKTKEEISEISFDYPSGRPDSTELLRYCDTNIMPFIYVLR